MKITKDWLRRALKTFWQAALGSLLISLPQIIELIPLGWDALEPVAISALCGALAAGISAFYNGYIAPKLNPETIEDNEDMNNAYDEEDGI